MKTEELPGLWGQLIIKDSMQKAKMTRRNETYLMAEKVCRWPREAIRWGTCRCLGHRRWPVLGRWWRWTTWIKTHQQVQMHSTVHLRLQEDLLIIKPSYLREIKKAIIMYKYSNHPWENHRDPESNPTQPIKSPWWARIVWEYYKVLRLLHRKAYQWARKIWARTRKAARRMDL